MNEQVVLKEKTERLELSKIKMGLDKLKMVCPKAEREMAESLARYGQLTPIIVYREKGEYQLIDGFKRVHAAEKIAEMDALTARELIGSDSRRKAAILRLNWPKRTVSHLEEALVVQGLVEDEGMAQKTVANLLGRDKSWVCRRLSLVARLDEKVHENLRLGLIKPSAARELALLPRGNQKEMVTCMVRNKLSYRQTQKVVAGMLANRNLTVDELVGQLDGPSHQTSDNPNAQLERRLWRVHRDCMSLIRQWGLLGGLAEGEPGSKRAATALINTLGQLRDHLKIFMEEEP